MSKPTDSNLGLVISYLSEYETYQNNQKVQKQKQNKKLKEKKKNYNKIKIKTLLYTLFRNKPKIFDQNDFFLMTIFIIFYDYSYVHPCEGLKHMGFRQK